MNRRDLMATGIASILASSLLAGRARGEAGNLYVGCRKTDDGHFSVAGFDRDAGAQFELPLPGRGHSVAFCPGTTRAIVFARRPGTFAVEFDYDAGVAIQRFDSGPKRHFYGHGVYSPDGRYLFTTENAYDTGIGKIGVRDVSENYLQIAEIESGGVGPHDLKLMPDTTALIVANGGIRTHPDRDREKLNLDSMLANLTFVDLADGALLDAFMLSSRLQKLSIRHLALAPNGDVALAMQYEGSKRDAVPLIGVFEGGRIRLFGDAAPLARRMRHYTGSIAYDEEGNLLAVSSPRSDLITIWDAQAGQLLHSLQMEDGAGVAPAAGDGRFVLTGFDTGLYPGSGDEWQRISDVGISQGIWDNHLIRKTSLLSVL